MTGELSVVIVLMIMMGKWSKNVVDIFRHCFSLTMWMLYFDL